MSIFRQGLLVAVVIFLIDRVSKWWFIDVFELPNKGIVEVLPFFNVVMVWNRGVSFGLLPADGDLGRWLLVAMTGFIVAGLAWWLRSVPSRLLGFAIGLVIGGATGNIYDRVKFEAVADFFQFFVGNWSFAVFNVADSFITLGAIILVWDAFFGPKPQEEK